MAKVINSTVDGKYLMFKGKPLVRQEDIICYGSMKDEFVLQLVILKKREVEIGGVKSEIPEKVFSQVMKKDPASPGGRKMIKQFSKSGLHDAFTIGYNYIQTLEKKA